jgi:hypothetical protein
LDKQEREKEGGTLFIFSKEKEKKNIYIIICKSDANDDGGAPPK